MIDDLITIERDEDARTVERRMPEPAKRWRNRWRATEIFHGACDVCGAVELILPGMAYENHCRVYPSKDVAETEATKPNFTGYWNVYLGAVEVSE